MEAIWGYCKNLQNARRSRGRGGDKPYFQPRDEVSRCLTPHFPDGGRLVEALGLDKRDVFLWRNQNLVGGFNHLEKY